MLARVVNWPNLQVLFQGFITSLHYQTCFAVAVFNRRCRLELWLHRLVVLNVLQFFTAVTVTSVKVRNFAVILFIIPSSWDLSRVREIVCRSPASTFLTLHLQSVRASVTLTRHFWVFVDHFSAHKSWWRLHERFQQSGWWYPHNYWNLLSDKDKSGGGPAPPVS